MALDLEDRDLLWQAIYAIVVAYEKGLLDIAEAKVMVEMVARGATRA